MFSGLIGLSHTLLITHLLMVAVYVCMCYQVVFEVAFNSARGGYVAIDDISFTPEFCHTDTGERRNLDFRGVMVDHKGRLLCIFVLNMLDSEVSLQC